MRVTSRRSAALDRERHNLTIDNTQREAPSFGFVFRFPAAPLWRVAGCDRSAPNSTWFEPRVRGNLTVDAMRANRSPVQSDRGLALEELRSDPLDQFPRMSHVENHGADQDDQSLHEVCARSGIHVRKRYLRDTENQQTQHYQPSCHTYLAIGLIRPARAATSQARASVLVNSASGTARVEHCRSRART
jgi:hypothetical protein